VERTAYFVVAESLAKVAKHAPDAQVQISLDDHGGDLLAEITDFGPGSVVCRVKGEPCWRVGGDTEIAWIRGATEPGLTIRSGIPPLFEAYATVELPRSGDGDQAAWSGDPDRCDAAVLAVLGRFTAWRSRWLGYLETGAEDAISRGRTRNVISLAAGELPGCLFVNEK
jgi:hypothetical protein